MDSVTKIQGPTYSDGDASHRPTNRPDLRKANEQGYLQKLALKWMQEVGMAKIGEFEFTSVDGFRGGRVLSSPLKS